MSYHLLDIILFLKIQKTEIASKILFIEKYIDFSSIPNACSFKMCGFKNILPQKASAGGFLGCQTSDQCCDSNSLLLLTHKGFSLKSFGE